MNRYQFPNVRSRNYQIQTKWQTQQISSENSHFNLSLSGRQAKQERKKPQSTQNLGVECLCA